MSDKKKKGASTELAVQNAILIVRETPVILANDLADFYETTVSAVNQYRSRNADKFTSDYAFQLSDAEWEGLKSQNVISKMSIR